ncbi:MAG: hypothetical protein LBJ72_12555 [Dysgonamonadaceae bacterium]|jgi:hypothetical protein|nr:hypothetical protein [Dysgonamonadaceae bacterium]
MMDSKNNKSDAMGGEIVSPPENSEAALDLKTQKQSELKEETRQPIKPKGQKATKSKEKVGQSTRLNTQKEGIKKLSKNKFSDKAKDLFKSHPGANELHFTSDGYAFFKKNDAQNHSRSLKEKEIETIKKEQ